MKASILSLTLGMFLGASTLAQGQEATKWKIDQAHTSVNFSINHFFSAVLGQFEEFDGKMLFDKDNLDASSFTFSIQVSSINTDSQKRDNHLQSKDFFNAKEWPEIKFVSSKITKVAGDNYMAHGKLTIRDVTKEVKIPFKITGEMQHPMMKGTYIKGLEFEYTLDRTEYGVGTGDWAATAVVGDEVKITIPMELNRKIGSS